MVTHCDIETGKIYGCKKGTKEWYHEKGHLKFNLSSKGSNLHMWQKYFFHLFMIFIVTHLAFGVGTLLIYLSFAGYFGIELYEEFWCEHYARKMIKLKGGKK